MGLRSVSEANQIIKPNVVPVPAFDRNDKGKTRENVRNKRTKKLLSSWTLSPGSRFGFVIIMRATHYTFTWVLGSSPRMTKKNDWIATRPLAMTKKNDDLGPGFLPSQE